MMHSEPINLSSLRSRDIRDALIESVYQIEIKYRNTIVFSLHPVVWADLVKSGDIVRGYHAGSPDRLIGFVVKIDASTTSCCMHWSDQV